MPTKHKVLLTIVGIVFIWSLVHPHDYLTWFLEVFPAIVGFSILTHTYNRYRLTDLAYTLIAIHAIILMIGGHYTYAEVPLFNWLRDIGVFTRNNYDKIGHFAQGFVPAIIIRELLIRKAQLTKPKWVAFLSIAVTGLITSVYEIIEWITAVTVGSGADAFLGTQGYVWDTQSDMAFCIVGGIISILILSKLHDHCLNKTQSI